MLLGKEIVGAKFWVKNTCLFTIVAGHIFRRGFDENNFVLTPLICARSGSMRRFVGLKKVKTSTVSYRQNEVLLFK